MRSTAPPTSSCVPSSTPSRPSRWPSSGWSSRSPSSPRWASARAARDGSVLARRSPHALLDGLPRVHAGHGARALGARVVDGHQCGAPRRHRARRPRRPCADRARRAPHPPGGLGHRPGPDGRDRHRGQRRAGPHRRARPALARRPPALALGRLLRRVLAARPAGARPSPSIRVTAWTFSGGSSRRRRSPPSSGGSAGDLPGRRRAWPPCSIWAS